MAKFEKSRRDVEPRGMKEGTRREEMFDKAQTTHHANKSVKKFAGGGFAGGFAEGYAGGKATQKNRGSKKNKLFSFGEDSGKDDRTLPVVDPITAEEPDPERFGGS